MKSKRNTRKNNKIQKRFKQNTSNSDITKPIIIIASLLLLTTLVLSVGTGSGTGTGTGSGTETETTGTGTGADTTQSQMQNTAQTTTQNTAQAGDGTGLGTGYGLTREEIKRRPSLGGHSSTGLSAGTFGGDEASELDVWSFLLGKVGIGTENPTEKLEVIGNIKATGTICGINGCVGEGGTGGTPIVVVNELGELDWVTVVEDSFSDGVHQYYETTKSFTTDPSLPIMGIRITTTQEGGIGEYCMVYKGGEFATLIGDFDSSEYSEDINKLDTWGQLDIVIDKDGHYRTNNNEKRIGAFVFQELESGIGFIEVESRHRRWGGTGAYNKAIGYNYIAPGSTLNYNMAYHENKGDDRATVHCKIEVAYGEVR